MNDTHSVVALARFRSRLETGAAKAIREAAGLSYLEAARAASVSPESVRRWERGANTPKGAAGTRYALVLDEFATNLRIPTPPVTTIPTVGEPL